MKLQRKSAKKITKQKSQPRPKPSIEVLLQSHTYYVRDLKLSLQVIELQNNYFLGLHRQHLLEHLMNFIFLSKKIPVFPKRQAVKKWNNLVLAFDLDQTLVHSSVKLVKWDHQIQLCSGQEKHIFKVSVRPHAIQVIKRLNEHFDLIVFTASIKEYAEKVVKILDPEGTIFKEVLSRDRCVEVEQRLLKDIESISSLDRIVLIDNSLCSYFFHQQNGLPVLPYYANPQDTQLLKLQKFLQVFRHAYDVRDIIRKYFDPEWLYRGGWMKTLQDTLKLVKEAKDLKESKQLKDSKADENKEAAQNKQLQCANKSLQ